MSSVIDENKMIHCQDSEDDRYRDSPSTSDRFPLKNRHLNDKRKHLRNYGSDSLILNPRYLRHEKSYPRNRTQPHLVGLHTREKFEPSNRLRSDMSSPMDRRILHRSLTSSEILDRNRMKYMAPYVIPNVKLSRKAGSTRSVRGYDGPMYAPKQLPRVPSVVNERSVCSMQSKSGPTVTPQASSYSSGSDVSVDPKAPSTVSTLPMGTAKNHGDAAAGFRQIYGSQYSLPGSQCCQNCHMLNNIIRPHNDSWPSQSTVIDGHPYNAEETNDGLSWRRLHMSRAKLKATATTSELLSGFAMVAMVELQINEPTHVPEWLFIMFSVCTTVLVAVHIFALMISTYLLPNIDAISKLHCTKLVIESPHERMKGFVELAWAFSTVLGLFLFLVEVAILCWVKFWDFSIRAAIAATIIVIPVLIIFVVFVFHFYRSLVVHKCKATKLDISELEEIKRKLDHISIV